MWPLFARILLTGPQGLISSETKGRLKDEGYAFFRTPIVKKDVISLGANVLED